MALSYRPPTLRAFPAAAALARRVVAALWMVSAPLLHACDAPPVAWEDIQRAGSGATGEPAALPALAWRPERDDPSGAACGASARYAGAGRIGAGKLRWYVAWWRARPDGNAWLMIARSDDGGARWSRAAFVDTMDASRLGCSRPPPGISADARYVHLAYFMNAPEGAGIFFAHSMDAGATFHTPVAIVYGDRPADVSVAASGDTVAVAYLDPNALRPHVALALSYTAGHVFERHALMVSGSGSAADSPRVSLRGREIDVAWIARHADPMAPAAAALAMTRRGTLR